MIIQWTKEALLKYPRAFLPQKILQKSQWAFLQVTDFRGFRWSPKRDRWLLTENPGSSPKLPSLRPTTTTLQNTHRYTPRPQRSRISPWCSSSFPMVSICSTRSFEFHWLIPIRMAFFPSGTSSVERSREGREQARLCRGSPNRSSYLKGVFILPMSWSRFQLLKVSVVTDRYKTCRNFSLQECIVYPTGPPCYSKRK